jgi:REP element-mobilizing transposase RayT
MGNTYTQIHIHCIIVVKYRHAMLLKSWRSNVFKYITGIVQKQGHKMIAINGVEDHVHLLFGLRPVQSLSDLMRIVKGDSSEWINKQKLCDKFFRWQEGSLARYRK